MVHVSLRSHGAPLTLGFLNGEWHRVDPAEGHPPRPRFVKQPLSSDAPWPAGVTSISLTFHREQEQWCATSDDGQHVFLRAQSRAFHPNTVDSIAWRLCTATGESGSPEQQVPGFGFAVEGPNTEAEPFQVEELGLDYFLRKGKNRTVVWFQDPDTKEVFHSAAKGIEGSTHSARLLPGKRWCPNCRKSISANNFQHQHLRSCAGEFSTPSGEQVAAAWKELREQVATPTDSWRRCVAGANAANVDVAGANFASIGAGANLASIGAPVADDASKKRPLDPVLVSAALAWVRATRQRSQPGKAEPLSPKEEEAAAALCVNREAAETHCAEYRLAELERRWFGAVGRGGIEARVHALESAVLLCHTPGRLSARIDAIAAELDGIATRMPPLKEAPPKAMPHDGAHPANTYTHHAFVPSVPAVPLANMTAPVAIAAAVTAD